MTTFSHSIRLHPTHNSLSVPQKSKIIAMRICQSSSTHTVLHFLTEVKEMSWKSQAEAHDLNRVIFMTLAWLEIGLMTFVEVADISFAQCWGDFTNAGITRTIALQGLSGVLTCGWLSTNSCVWSHKISCVREGGFERRSSCTLVVAKYPSSQTTMWIEKRLRLGNGSHGFAISK